MDIMFDSFNSATAYSGPAAIRLLRASCGQLSHHDLYQPVNQQCYLFDNTAARLQGTADARSLRGYSATS